MSHFTVLVVGAKVDEQMEPYAEEGYDPKYAQFQDIEEEALIEYSNKDIEIVILNNGKKYFKHDPQFHCFDTKSLKNDYIFPDGSTFCMGKFTDIYPTFEDFMTNWHSMPDRDETKNRYGYWSNPNAKYDWYQMGGRWSGFFNPKNFAKGTLGSPGVFNNEPTNGWVDSIRLCDIDVQGMLDASVKEASETYDKLEAILKGRPLPSWNNIRDKHGENIDDARAEYNSLQVVKDFNEAKFHVWGDFIETFCNTRDEYIEKCKNQTMVTYAVVKDGKWYQKGEMGWWGMSNDEMTQDEWNRKFWEMINSLDPETELTLLDCHI